MVIMMHAGVLPGTEEMKGRTQTVPLSSVRVWRKTGWVLVDEYYALYPDEKPAATEEPTTAP